MKIRELYKDWLLTVSLVAVVGFALLGNGFQFGQQANAQDQPKASSMPIPSSAKASPAVIRDLTKEELERWTALGQVEMAYNQGVNEIIKQAVSLQVEDKVSMQIHSAIKDSNSNLVIGLERRKTFIAQMRAEAGCKDCIIMEGKLVKPITPAEAPIPVGKK
jgi:hypothetical protein